MVVYRYIVKDLNLPKDKQLVYSTTGNDKKNLVIEEGIYQSTEDMIKQDRKKPNV